MQKIFISHRCFNCLTLGWLVCLDADDTSWHSAMSLAGLFNKKKKKKKGKKKKPKAFKITDDEPKTTTVSELAILRLCLSFFVNGGRCVCNTDNTTDC